MPIKFTLDFTESERPIQELVTKFGGDPVWFDEPQWPLNPMGRPMTFIGQIRIEPEIFGPTVGQMAYLFIGYREENGVDNTWDENGGENAVVVQPGRCPVATAPLRQGPSIAKRVRDSHGFMKGGPPAEWGAILTAAEDPDFLSEEARYELEEEDHEKYAEQVEGNKIGGVPCFLQMDQFVPGFPLLLVQLDSGTTPMHLEFGDLGTGYAFLNEDGSEARFFWQCT